MALFGFADIKFDKGPPTRRGPLGKLVGSEFQQTTLRYPLDIGNYDKAHYVVFYIREQINSSRPSRAVSESASQFKPSGGIEIKNIGDSSQLASNFGNEILGKINSGLNQLNGATGGALSGLTSALSKAAGGAVSGVTGSVNNIFGQSNIKFGGNSAESQSIIDNSIKRITNNSFLKTTRLTKDAIALYMPDTLQYKYSQSYDQLSLGGEGLGQALAAGASIMDAFESGKGAMDTISKTAAAAGESGKLFAGQKAAGAIGAFTNSSQTAQLGFTALTGAVQNPMLEMIYKSPNFRSFQFDFLFYPRDEKEALEVQRILERFRFHQAPDLREGAQGFLVPPSEFDIKFYYAGSENPNIPQITTCVLASFDVNYAPNGFSAYEVPGENNPALGRTGMPTSIQVTMEFQETSYLTKQDFTSDSEFESRELKARNTFASQSGQFGSS